MKKEDINLDEGVFNDPLRESYQEKAQQFYFNIDSCLNEEKKDIREFEYKRMLTKESYEMIYHWCKQLYQETKSMHINYYYDTPDCACNNNGIAVRVRQKGTELEGVIKYHCVANTSYTNNEQQFRVCYLPMYMEYGGRWVSLMGQMVTERISVPVAEGVNLILEQNYYLGETDHELEVEFLESAQAKANSFLQWLGQQFALQAGGKNKSARYFDTLMAKKEGSYRVDKKL